MSNIRDIFYASYLYVLDPKIEYFVLFTGAKAHRKMFEILNRYVYDHFHFKSH